MHKQASLCQLGPREPTIDLTDFFTSINPPCYLVHRATVRPYLEMGRTYFEMNFT